MTLKHFAAEHLEFCKSNNLKGRILVSTEGINGTLSGTKEDTDKYIEHMHSDERFADMTFKIDEAEGHAFKKMHVRPRNEIVALGLEDDVDPRVTTGKYYSPSEFKEALEDEDTVILDARNDYELCSVTSAVPFALISHASETYQTGFVRTKIN